MAKYDRIGDTYNTTRRADPYLFGRMLHFLNPEKDKTYLDVGCGTGNYTIKFIDLGFQFTGVDPSEKMLEAARSRRPESRWTQGVSEDLPLEDEEFDGALATLTTHHWSDLEKGFAEISRVLTPGSKLVLFTSTPFQMETLWLNEYFPQMISDSAADMHSFEDTEAAMKATGIEVLTTENYDVHPELEDMFLLSGTHNPSLYLDSEFRNGISSFSAIVKPSELNAGLHHLEQDIKSGRINGVIDAWKTDRGQYLFIQARKA